MRRVGANMATGMTRPRRLYGPNGRLGVGSTKFWADYVYNNDVGGEQFIPGTNVPRLKLAKLGERAVAAFDDEVDALIEGLRAERDAAPRRMPPLAPPKSAHGGDDEAA